jgi:hypothetical protein
LLTTWTGGSCGIAVEALRRELPEQTRVMELGYQSTEVRGTMALEPETSAGMPALHHHFFEFVEQHAWDGGSRATVTLDELQPGIRYYVIATTASGLYRYFMNDLLEVTGRFQNTPLLRFLQKGSGVTSLTGEKVYEAHAIAAVQHGARETGAEPCFFLVVADEHRMGYELFVELSTGPPEGGPCIPPIDLQAFGASVDEHLGRINAEYHSKRASGRLAPVVVTVLSAGSADAYKAAHLRSGVRESQFKPKILQYRRDLRWQPVVQTASA